MLIQYWANVADNVQYWANIGSVYRADCWACMYTVQIWLLYKNLLVETDIHLSAILIWQGTHITFVSYYIYIF